MSFSLIVPIAANKPEYQQRMPYVFLSGNDGMLLCIKAIMGLNLNEFDGIYYTLLREIDDRYALTERLKLQFKLYGINAKVVVIDEPTLSQPETVYCTICKENICGSIFIKDSDNRFVANIKKENSIAIYPLEKLKWVNPQDKSYVSIDDMNYVTNVIEKRIVSHFFSAGGYCFEDVNDFIHYFKKYKKLNKLYLSHIIYSMLLDNHVFRPIEVNKYEDFDVFK